MDHSVAGKNDSEIQPIIVKRVIKKAHEHHHGGAWKVAYADFTTAMMAFFMLLWLLNVATKDTLTGLADYFTPTTATVESTSGSGNVLSGTAPVEDGSQSSGSVAIAVEPTPPARPDSSDSDAEATPTKPDQFESTINEIEDARLNRAAAQIMLAIQDSPELREHEDQLVIDQTPEGMRIQIIDKDRRAMFREGTPDLYNYAVDLIESVGGVVEDLPNRIAVLGHTDASQVDGPDEYSNWELSADRANAARRVLGDSGVTTDRFSEVTGKADTEPMYPDNPMRPENRRITIMVLREAPVLDPEYGRN